MTYGLAGKRVVITGAGSGIGLATTRKLVEEGAIVIAGDLNVSALSGVIEKANGIALQSDLRKGGAELLATTAIEKFDGIDVLVCCAGIAPTRDGLASTVDSEFCETFDVNVLGVVRACRAAVPHMAAKSKGSVIAIASDFGRMPEPLFYDYCMSKSAVLSFMKSLSIEFGPKGVRANCVSPGATLTGMWERPGGFLDQLSTMWNMDRDKAVEHFAKVHKKFALQRIGKPEEIAEVVLFLASDRSSFVTGSDYWVNGGSIPLF